MVRTGVVGFVLRVLSASKDKFRKGGLKGERRGFFFIAECLMGRQSC